MSIMDLSQVNPARAGMIPFELALTNLIHRKPRASGDDPGLIAPIDGAPV